MKLPTRPETFACHPAEVAGDGFFPVHEPHISANEYPHNQMKSIQIGDLKITLPIIQGGMGVGISLSGLASAVANEGGVGVISCAGIGLIYPKFSNDYRTNSIMGLREEIRKARAKTSGVIGVNIMVALSNFADMVRTAIEEKADIIFSGAGLPLDLPSYLGEKSLTKLVPIVSSARAAHIICEKWKTNYNYLPDAIVVEGPKAGGHLGFKREEINDPNFALEVLVPQVVEAAKRNGYEVVQIADHGNADNAINADGTPNTAHSLNPVPIVVVSDRVKSVRSGILADVAPTVLKLMGLEQPAEMTGKALVEMK